MPREIHNCDLEKRNRKEADRFDGDQMFWKQHSTQIVGPLPPNFHGPAPPAPPEFPED